ncbi:MAG: sigma-70 family RNA polymerase sigma factor [Actinomycetota bacterium]
MGIAPEDPTEAGTAVGFEELFEREALAQVQRASLLLGSVAEANDVVQEAFARLLERWDDLDAPGPYLNRTVLNLCRDQARHRGRQRRLLGRLAGRPDRVETAEVLDDVLERLPFNQRAAVVLRFWGGLTTAEIAAELGCAPGSVGPWISRALSTMRKELR